MGKLYVVIEFRKRYLINPNLIGRKISFTIKDSEFTSEKLNCQLCFPKQNENCESLLTQPVDDLVVMPNSWGVVNHFDSNDIPYVESIVVVIEGENVHNSSKEIKEKIFNNTNGILKILRCLYPNAVERYNPKTLVDGIYLQTFCDGKPRVGEINIALNLETNAPKKWIEVKGIITAIKNLKKELSLALSLYDNALDYYGENDYRACILDCATLIESLMKRSLIQIISQNVQNSNLSNKLIKEANQYSKIKNYLKELSSMPVIDADFVFDTRNKIIHVGYRPNQEETRRALLIAKRIIEYYNVPLFEN